MEEEKGAENERCKALRFLKHFLFTSDPVLCVTKLYHFSVTKVKTVDRCIKYVAPFVQFMNM